MRAWLFSFGFAAGLVLAAAATPAAATTLGFCLVDTLDASSAQGGHVCTKDRDVAGAGGRKIAHASAAPDELGASASVRGTAVSADLTARSQAAYDDRFGIAGLQDDGGVDMNFLWSLSGQGSVPALTPAGFAMSWVVFDYAFTRNGDEDVARGVFGYCLDNQGGVLCAHDASGVPQTVPYLGLAGSTDDLRLTFAANDVHNGDLFHLELSLRTQTTLRYAGVPGGGLDASMDWAHTVRYLGIENQRNLAGLMTASDSGFEYGTLYGDAPPQAGAPEPATWAMMLAGFGLAGGAIRRRRAATA